ncbi:hypothetical protein [Rhodococcoides yunnanense]|uniref:hypothetical protein n=1 Tax=Rhodococcoides yunnanense TaxID=278209 RepID=UPI000934DEEF|nr:hypothetical protein [Rhodococcus yunnanensis]
MDTLDLVLASPRGRFFSANVAYLCSADERADYSYRPRTPEDVLEVIEGIDVRSVADLSELDLLGALSFAVDWARYWQPPDEEDEMFARADVVAALRPVARAVLASANTRWWSDPLDFVHQHFVVHPYSSDGWPDSTARLLSAPVGLDQWRTHALEMEAQFRGYREERRDRRIGGEWWSIPSPSGALATSRSRPNLGSVELLLEEDSSGCGVARVWPVRVLDTPRVYEITGPADWANLVDSYPLAVPESRRSVWFDTTGEYRDWFIPDWSAVARDHDAVHLSLIGYLTTPGIAIPLSSNAGATVLAGWDPDATWWLSKVFTTIDDEYATWRRGDDLWLRD